MLCVGKCRSMLVEKKAAFGLGEGKKVAGLQGSEIKPIARRERKKWRAKGKRKNGKEFDGESYRKVFVHKACRARRW